MSEKLAGLIYITDFLLAGWVLVGFCNFLLYLVTSPYVCSLSDFEQRRKNIVLLNIISKRDRLFPGTKSFIGRCQYEMYQTKHAYIPVQ